MYISVYVICTYRRFGRLGLTVSEKQKCSCGPLGPCAGPHGPPWPLMGRALMGRALMGPWANFFYLSARSKAINVSYIYTGKALLHARAGLHHV